MSSEQDQSLLLSSTESLFGAALALPAGQRAVLAEKLLESLQDEEIREEIQAAWVEEAERRLSAYREGRIRTIPGDEVFAELYAKFNK